MPWRDHTPTLGAIGSESRQDLLMDYSTLGVHVVGIETEEIDVIVRRTREKKRNPAYPEATAKLDEELGRPPPRLIRPPVAAAAPRPHPDPVRSICTCDTVVAQDRYYQATLRSSHQNRVRRTPVHGCPWLLSPLVVLQLAKQ